MQENRYFIGTFAKILGIPVDTIRYYEKEGLLLIRRDESNYRYFTDVDCRILIMCRMLRSLGMSIKEIKDSLKEGGTERFVRSMEGNIFSLEEQISQLERKREIMRLYRDAGEQLLREPGAYSIVEEPFRAFFFQQTKGIALTSKSEREDFNILLMEQMPFAGQTALLPLDALRCGKLDSDLVFGLLIEERFCAPSVPVEEATVHIAWNTCVRTILSWPYSEQIEDHAAMLQPLLHFAAAHGLAPCGSAIGRLLPIEFGEGFHWHVQYSIPVQLL